MPGRAMPQRVITAVDSRSGGRGGSGFKTVPRGWLIDKVQKNHADAEHGGPGKRFSRMESRTGQNRGGLVDWGEKRGANSCGCRKQRAKPQWLIQQAYGRVT